MKVRITQFKTVIRAWIHDFVMVFVFSEDNI